jgi:hypothetical protein
VKKGRKKTELNRRKEKLRRATDERGKCKEIDLRKRDREEGLGWDTNM